ncbi:unnamed protein product [Microthlaspi erraticum]|uniref:Arabidopsis retrotransposon Orf1 C-terminal domain-containing protein n=2 Tax=Microthlaspi erraticum TaxID=1685480 RepID=A0A6D2HJS9_9BRAS|nr:unnamed protein product [Microthlaspi erraticum]
MQLTRLMMNPLPAYQKETIEFLSTLRVNFYEPDEIVPEGHGSGRFSFRINKRKYRMSFKELEDVFHFEHKDGRETEPGTPQGRASSLLGNDRSWRVHASTAKSTHIRNPVLRYVHKALAHTIYARRDVTGVTEKELFFLNEGMKKVIHTLPDGLRWSGTIREQRGDVSSQELPQLQGVCSLSQQSAQGKQWSAELWRTHNADPHELGITLEKPVDPQAINIQYLRKSTYLAVNPSADATTISSPIGSLNTGLASFFLRTTLDLHHGQENIDFEPPIETILEQGQEEEDYAHPGAAGEGESSGDVENLMDYKTGEFHFKNHEIKGRKSAANTALESINTLKAWNQFQDKAIKSLLKTVKKMGKRIKQLTKGKSKSPSHDSDNTPPIHLGSYHDDDVVEDSEEGDEGSSKFQTAETSTRKRKASKSPQASTKGDSTSSSSSDSF